MLIQQTRTESRGRTPRVQCQQGWKFTETLAMIWEELGLKRVINGGGLREHTDVTVWPSWTWTEESVCSWAFLCLLRV